RSCSLCRYCASPPPPPPPPLVPADPLVKREMKYVLVTGGVVSGLGKGVTASSIGVVLKACGLRVTSIKIGLSVLNAISRVPGIQKALSVVCFTKQAFVPKVDLDLGNYERFLDIKLTRDNNITTGKIYQVLGQFWLPDHRLYFHCKVVPHITDAIQEWIERVAMIPVDGKEGPADVCVIELGGTIGKMPLRLLIEEN
ncbi:hypothetical protein B296_00002646, partial [Ensete ventricosum]